MKEIGEVAHLEVEVDGVDESPICIDVEPINPGVRQPGPGLCLRHRGARWWVGPPLAGWEHVLLPGAAVGRRRRRWKAHEAQGGHDGLQLVVGHDGLEGSRVPHRQLPHTLLHVFLHRTRRFQHNSLSPLSLSGILSAFLCSVLFVASVCFPGK